MLISTAGHTVGHQSLLVRLPKTGSVILAGDAAQIREQWDRWTASPTTYDQRLAPGMRRLGELVAKYKAQVWFSHDPTQANQQRAERKYFE
jgi:N-acyl homoserine lactone hydrolase